MALTKQKMNSLGVTHNSNLAAFKLETRDI